MIYKQYKDFIYYAIVLLHKTAEMLHFQTHKPLDSYTKQGSTCSKKQSRHNTQENQLPYNIIKKGSLVIEQSIIDIVEELIARRLVLNQVCSIDSFPMRHSAAFITGTNKWREKGGYRGEFNERGPFRLLLWEPC